MILVLFTGIYFMLLLFLQGVGIFWGSLYIRDVQTFHGGMYTCRAETASDNFEASAILNVVGK